MAQFTPTIPIASVSGGDPKLTITGQHWQRIQDTYGNELSPDLRKEIYEATISFLRFVPTERAAQPILFARTKITQIIKTAQALQKAIFKYPQSDAGDATLHANHLINRCFDHPLVKNRDKLGFIGTLMTSLAVACEGAFITLDDPANRGRRKGETWENWVRKLTEIFKAHRLPTAARKDTDKNKTGKPSPFVAFIQELQKCFPAEFRRSTQSDEALAKSIYES